MIKYSLNCVKDHAFESWFPDSESFDTQVKRGFVECPLCASKKVFKALMAPIFIVMILAMMVLPLPPFALDLFFTFNIAMALMVMMVKMASMIPIIQKRVTIFGSE